MVKNSRTLEAAPLQPLPKGEPTNPHHQQSNVYSTHYNQFSDDLIEDEFNELNEGIVETEMGSLQRNIIPDQGFEMTNKYHIFIGLYWNIQLFIYFK